MILALETNTFARSGFILIFTSSFFLDGIIPPLGSKKNVLSVSILNSIF